MGDIAKAIEDASTTAKGRALIDGGGVEVQTPTLTAPLDGWDHILEMFGLDPSSYIIVEDTVKCSVWQQSKRLENGDRDTVNLYSYSARFTRRANAAPLDLTAWRGVLKNIKNEKPTGLPVTGGCYVICVGDAQLGKPGTEQAATNWREGILNHTTQIKKLKPAAVHVALMGDEIENMRSYCVAADEPVLTLDLRWVPAGDLQIGDKLYAFDEEKKDKRGRRYCPSRVEQHEVKELPCLKITFSDGETLTCTPEHPILVKFHESQPWRWVQAQDLMARTSRKGYETKTYLAAKIPMWKEDTSYEAGWLAGMFDGEGSFAGRNKQRVSNNCLSVAQNPGPILDRLKISLSEKGFQFTVSRGKNFCKQIRLKGGYFEHLKFLGSIRPNRLISKLAYPHVHANKVRVVGVEDAGVQRVAVMSTSSRTYISKGVLSHNSHQAYAIELNLTEQMELASDLTVWTIKELVKLGLPLSVSSVPSNHGELARGAGKGSITSVYDNSSTHITRQVKKLFEELGYKNIQWFIPDAEPSAVVTLSGVQCYFTHGYIEKGRGGTANSKVGKIRDAVEKQILGRTLELAELRVAFTAHYHHHEALEFGGRTLFMCPALEAEGASDEYMLHQYGEWSKPGMLGVLINSEYPRGWNYLSIF